MQENKSKGRTTKRSMLKMPSNRNFTSKSGRELESNFDKMQVDLTVKMAYTCYAIIFAYYVSAPSTMDVVFGPNPVRMTCPHCNREIITAIEVESDRSLQYCLIICMFIFCFILGSVYFNFICKLKMQKFAQSHIHNADLWPSY